MVSPGLSQAMRAEVTSQTNLFADGRDELPGLATSNRLREIIGFGIEEKEMLWIFDDIGVSRKILPEYFPGIGIDKDLVAFAAFLLFDSETLFDYLSIIYEMTDLQT